MADDVDMTGFRTDQFMYDQPGNEQESLPGFKTDAPLYGGGDGPAQQGDWESLVTDIAQYGSGLDASASELIDGVKSLFGGAYDKSYSTTRDLLASDDPVQKYLKDDGGIFSQIFKSAKESYGGLDTEGKKFVWNTLTGLLNYNHAKRTADATAKLADASMMNAQTNAATLQNKINLQGAVGNMNFKPRAGGGLIYQNLPGQKGV